MYIESHSKYKIHDLLYSFYQFVNRYRIVLNVRVYDVYKISKTFYISMYFAIVLTLVMAHFN